MLKSPVSYFLISTFFWFVMCLHEWLMWPIVYLCLHAPHVRLRQSCRIFKWMSWVEVGQEDRVSGGKSSKGVDVEPMWRICHVLDKFWMWNGGVLEVLLSGGKWRLIRAPFGTVFSPSFLPSVCPLNCPPFVPPFIPFSSFFFLHVSLLGWKHSHVSSLLLICHLSSSFSPWFSLSSFPFLLIFSNPALLLSLLKCLLPCPHHHLPLLTFFSPSCFSSLPLISPPFFFSPNHSYPSFSFLPAPIFSSSLLPCFISPFLSSASLIVPSIALNLPLLPLVYFLAFTLHWSLFCPPFPSLFLSYLRFSSFSFTWLYF